MTIQEIIDKILAYHPNIVDRRTCDVIVGADPNRECTGLLISIASTVQSSARPLRSVRTSCLFMSLLSSAVMMMNVSGWKGMKYTKKNWICF